MIRLITSVPKKALLIATMLTLSAMGLAQTQQPKTLPGTSQSAAKVDRLLKESGLKNQKYAEGVWLVEASGKDFPVLVAASGDVVVIGVIVAKKGSIPFSQEFLYKVAKLNHEYDFVKVGLDSEDDLFARTERKVAGMTASDFKESFDQVVAATSNVVAQLKSFVTQQYCVALLIRKRVS